MDSNLLSLLGLCKRAGKLSAGDDAAAEIIESHGARLVLLASDAAENLSRRMLRLAEESGCVALTVPFQKAELGQALGRGESAVLALTDLGLAASVTEKLAAEDPARYGAAAERLRVKVRRAAERKANREAEKEAARLQSGAAEKAPRRGTEERGDAQPKERKPDAGFHRGPRPDYRDGKPGGGFHQGSRPFSQGGKSNSHGGWSHSSPVKKGKGSFRRKDPS